MFDILHTSYATLSGDIPWNIPRVTYIAWYTHEPVSYQENISDEWDILLLYPEKGLHNYFIPYHRKYSGEIGGLV